MPEDNEFLKEVLKLKYITDEGDEIEVDLATELLDYNVPKKALLDLPATYGFIGTICATLLARAIELTDDLITWEAEKDDEIRMTGIKGEAKIKKTLQTDPTWARKRIKINKAWRDYMKSKSLHEALALKYGVIDRMTHDEKFLKDLKIDLSFLRPTILDRGEKLGTPPRRIGKVMIPMAAKRGKALYKKVDEEEEES